MLNTRLSQNFLEKPQLSSLYIDQRYPPNPPKTPQNHGKNSSGPPPGHQAYQATKSTNQGLKGSVSLSNPLRLGKTRGMEGTSGPQKGSQGKLDLRVWWFFQEKLCQMVVCHGDLP